MRRRVLLFIPLAACVWLGAATIRGEEPIVTVFHEPHHRQVFQWGTTRILDAQLPPGDTTWFHTHEAPVLYITLSSSQNRSQILGEDWPTPGAGRGRAAGAGNESGAPAAAPARGPAPAPGTPGSARIGGTISYVEKPITHRLQNVGSGLFRFMVVINESSGDETATPQANGFPGTPETSNRYFRAYRFMVNPGETTPKHKHPTPVAIFQTSDGRGLGLGAMKFDFTESGRWAFFDSGDVHEIRNTGAAPVEFVEVEVRQAVK